MDQYEINDHNNTFYPIDKYQQGSMCDIHYSETVHVYRPPLETV